MCINDEWDKIIETERKKSYFKELGKFVKSEYSKTTVFPAYKDIFNALKLVDYSKVKVVILGQDPYHEKYQAQGLSFSVPMGIKAPPSLVNIFNELKNDIGVVRTNTDLTDWAQQGVLLLNSIMTVEEGKPLSHKDKGWEVFTDTLIQKLNESNNPIVFIFWGSYAKSKSILITNPNHKVLTSVHPSPLSAHRGFFGSKPFSKTNQFLLNRNLNQIKW